VTEPIFSPTPASETLFMSMVSCCAITRPVAATRASDDTASMRRELFMTEPLLVLTKNGSPTEWFRHIRADLTLAAPIRFFAPSHADALGYRSCDCQNPCQRC